MKQITLEELLEAGCHFGHQVSRQNPKAREFIFEARNKIHIIDLEKTKEGLDSAAEFIKATAAKNGTLLIVSTKRQAESIVREELGKLSSENATGVYSVTKRWIGGTLTNSGEVAKNYQRLHDLSTKLQDPKKKAQYTKKEIGQWEKEKAKLEGFYAGITGMHELPSALLIIDTHHEHVAVHEARKMGVPIVGVVDTNADPTLIDYPIPGNDDAAGALKLYISHLFAAWSEGKSKKEETVKDSEKEAKKATEGQVSEPKEKKAETKKVTEKKEADSTAKPKASAKKADDTKKAKKVTKKEAKK